MNGRVASGIWIKVNKRYDGWPNIGAVSEDGGGDAEELQEMLEKESRTTSVSSPVAAETGHSQVKQSVSPVSSRSLPVTSLTQILQSSSST